MIFKYSPCVGAGRSSNLLVPARHIAAAPSAWLPRTASSSVARNKQAIKHIIRSHDAESDTQPKPPGSIGGVIADALAASSSSSSSAGGSGSSSSSSSRGRSSSNSSIGSSRKPKPQVGSRFSRPVKPSGKAPRKAAAATAEEDDSTAATARSAAAAAAAAPVPWYLSNAKKAFNTPTTATAAAAADVGASAAEAAKVDQGSEANTSALQDTAVQLSVENDRHPQQQQQQQQAVATADSLPSSSSSSSSAALSEQLLSDKQISQLQQYLNHMLEVNKSMNLTAIRDPIDAWERHIEDSLALLPVIDRYLEQRSSSSSSSSPLRRRIMSSSTANSDKKELQQQQQQQQPPLTVIDVGTGAGLPGMVLAVARPEWKVTLLDSLRKRCTFLQETADMLGLANVTVVWSRAEEGAARPELRESHDLAVARAVAELRVLAELCLPFVKPGGMWVAAKGANPEAEVSAAHNALSKLGGKLLAVEPVQSWAPEGQRTAVVVAKTGGTPAKYPRAPGTPNKKPL